MTEEELLFNAAVKLFIMAEEQDVDDFGPYEAAQTARQILNETRKTIWGDGGV